MESTMTVKIPSKYRNILDNEPEIIENFLFNYTRIREEKKYPFDIKKINRKIKIADEAIKKGKFVVADDDFFDKKIKMIEKKVYE